MFFLSPCPWPFLWLIFLCLPSVIVFTTLTYSGPTFTYPLNTTATNGGATASSVSTTTISDPVIKSAVRYTMAKKLIILSQRPQPPSPEEAEDHRLFRRAVAYHPNPSPLRKIAFLFLTKNSLPLSPLWEMFFNQTAQNHYNIYIHADPRFRPDPPFSGVFRNRVIPSSKRTRRHSPTLISAARRLLSHALLDDPSNAMFAILSPSCIPLRSFNFTYETLINSRKSYIEILKNESGAYERWAVRGEHAMLPELPFEDFRTGSQFFVLTRHHARVVAGDRRLWEKFKLPCEMIDACYPEENYFSTLMSMEDPRGCIPATLTHVDWRGRYDGHPRTYNATQVNLDLIIKLRNHRPRYGDEENINGSDSYSIKRHTDPFLFARKFSPDAIQPLITIASDVIFRD